ncbi:MAG: hypothetical protein ACOYD4_11720 [Solirubrobacterales bacterium]
MSEIFIAAGFSALLIGVGHWFPWRAILHRDLHRTEAYIYGLLAILGPSFAVLWLHAEWFALALITACALAAGLTTVATKGLDKITAYRNELHDRRQRDS